MFSKFDKDAAQRFGVFVRSIRCLRQESQTDLGARCMPPIRLARLSLIERGRAKVQPSEIRALAAALPAVAEIVRKTHRQQPVLGMPAGRHAPRAPEPAR
jgi:hypothetical protein